MKPTADGFLVTNSMEEMGFAAAHDLVRLTDWAATIPRETFAVACANSLCFGVLGTKPVPGWPHSLVGFARVVTDHATYAYLCDVIVHPDVRGLGLSHALVRATLEHPSLKGLRRYSLLTRFASSLYRQHGFVDGETTVTYLERRGVVYTRES